MWFFEYLKKFHLVTLFDMLNFDKFKSFENEILLVFLVCSAKICMWTKIWIWVLCAEVLTNIRGGKYRNPSHSKFKGKNHIGAKNDLCLRCQNQSSSSSSPALSGVFSPTNVKVRTTQKLCELYWEKPLQSDELGNKRAQLKKWKFKF